MFLRHKLLNLSMVLLDLSRGIRQIPANVLKLLFERNHLLFLCIALSLCSNDIIPRLGQH